MALATRQLVRRIWLRCASVLVMFVVASLLGGCGNESSTDAPIESAKGTESASGPPELAAPEPDPAVPGMSGETRDRRRVIKAELRVLDLDEAPEDFQDVRPDWGLLSVPALSEWLADGDFEGRKAAAKQLGKLGTRADSAEAALEKALQDKAGSVRVAAAEALWRVTGHSEKAVRVLRELLRRGGTGLRIESAWALGSIGSAARAAVPELVKLSGGTLPQSRETIPYEEDSPVIEGAYINWTQKSAAAKALGQIGGRPTLVLAALLDLQLTGTSWEMEVAAEALKQLKPR